MKKTLVFRFFVPSEYKENIAIRMHFESLKRYSHIFDSAIFSICFENDDMSRAAEVEKDIMDCGFVKDVRFVLEENSPFTESIAIKKYILDRLEELDGLVFFGHTKGVTNVKTFSYDVDSKLKWVYSLYFYNLEFIDDVERNLIYCTPYIATFYGALRTTMDECKHFHYPGTFYWINPKGLYNDVNSGLVTIPKLANRSFGESLPIIYETSDTCHAVACYGQRWMYWYDLYHGNMDAVIKLFGEYDLFYRKYNEIIDNIK